MAALVWRRLDFSESSRLVTLLTRDQGKVKALAKGAYRPGSPFLGKLDWLNLVEPSFLRQRSEDSLRILRGVELVHEPRALRQPRRFLCAGHLASIFDAALPEGRADQELFDLLAGALVVLERCPEPALPTAVAGLELRYLQALGELPDATTCADCGAPFAPGARVRLGAGGRALVCAAHRPRQGAPLPAGLRRELLALHETPARSWSALPAPSAALLGLLGRWLEAVLEARPRLRAAALAQPSVGGEFPLAPLPRSSAAR